MSVDTGDLAADRARLEIVRRRLGARLASYRTAAEVSQPELAAGLGRTRSRVSKIEHGCRGMPERLWKIADDLCGAEDALIGEHSSRFLCLLGKPKQAVDAASTAPDRLNRTFVGSYDRCQVRLGHALVIDKEITEATRILGDVAHHASFSPRLTKELHATRALMQPWHNTPAVKTLDTRLQACSLIPPPQHA